ncbi:MAG TPA: hypothetical protein VFO35_04590 [Steroidobacteraceae bacterium]|nr:hypothetical protein [Steroidobacteraceae bacterium]
MERDVLIVAAIVVAAGAALAWERRETVQEKAKAAAEAARPLIVVARMADADKFADPLGVALERANLGKVIGSGTDLIVELTDLEPGVALIKRELLRLGASRDATLAFRRNSVDVVESVRHLYLEPGKRYRVIKAFADHDRDRHPEGEEWTFLRSVFTPYHSGMSWFVSFDGRAETHIRLQGIPEEQGYVLDNLAEFLVEA